MDKTCFLCNQIFKIGSLKTSRSRFKQIGITPPDGMGPDDKICSNCLNKLYNEQVKQATVSSLQKNLKNDLLRLKDDDLLIRKKVGTEKAKKFL